MNKVSLALAGCFFLAIGVSADTIQTLPANEVHVSAAGDGGIIAAGPEFSFIGQPFISPEPQDVFADGSTASFALALHGDPVGTFQIAGIGYPLWFRESPSLSEARGSRWFERQCHQAHRKQPWLGAPGPQHR